MHHQPSILFLVPLMLSACVAQDSYELDTANSWGKGECHDECSGPNVECGYNIRHEELDRPSLCEADLCAEGFADADLDFANGCETNLFEQKSVFAGSIAADSKSLRLTKDHLQGTTDLSLFAKEEDGGPLPNSLGFVAVLYYPKWAVYDVSMKVIGDDSDCELQAQDRHCFEGICSELIAVEWPDRFNKDDSHTVLFDLDYLGMDHANIDHSYNPAAFNSIKVNVDALEDWKEVSPQRCF